LGPEVLLGSLEYAFPDVNDAFPLLSANTDLTAILDMQKYVKEYVIKQYGNTKVGIFGLTTPATTLLSNPSASVVLDEILTIAVTIFYSLRTV
jgi:2',3'-cyclic-nucleotide 2'-phosphodiesterase (5'-nucleotidase family)